MKAIRLCAALLVVLAACEPGRGTAPPGSAGPDHRSAAAHRQPTRPRPAVRNAAAGADRELISRAVADLRTLGLWTPLTRHLYRLQLGARPGATNVPPDKHLADAFLTAVIDQRGSGALCDVLFYPTAIRRDLERQARFHAQGLLPDPPPTLRQFWVSILGHELAHCLPHEDFFRQRGERTAERWEARVLAAARRRL
jgi:hypothetical protein